MRMLIVALVLFMPVSPVFSGTILSMKDAERLFLENSPEIRTKRIELQKGDAAVVEAQALPNPVAHYTMESVDNGSRETEETYSVSQSLDISGKRGRRIDAARKSREARGFSLEQEIRGLVSEMKRTYVRILLLKENEKALAELIGFFSDVERKTKARVSAGDAAEADLMKLSAEKGKIARSLEALRTDLKSEKKKLGMQLNMQDVEFEIAEDFTARPLSENTRNVSVTGPENRPDILARLRAIEAAEMQLAAAKREAFPPIEVEGGYKKRTGGFSGFVFGISVPLPFFDRNQGGIARAEAELAQEKIAYEASRRNAAAEIGLLCERLEALEMRLEDLSGQLSSAKKLSRIAGIAYEEGETGLLELLDAVRSEKELVMENNAAMYDHWAARFELERASGAAEAVTGEKK